MYLLGDQEDKKRTTKETRKMNIYLDLLILSAIVCYIVDVSGFSLTLKKLVAKTIFRNSRVNPVLIDFKPFTCSLCMTFWTGIIYSICINSFSILVLGYICLLSLNSKNISGLEIMVRENLNYLIAKITI